MSVFSIIDQKKEEDGVFVDLPADYIIGDVPDEKNWPQLKLAKWQNQNHQKQAIDLRKKRFPRRSIDDLDSDESMSLLREIMSKTIVLDWRNITDIEGNEIAYSPNLCQEWLENDRDLMSWVMEESQRREHYYRDRLGKSKPKLASTSNT